MLINFLNKVQNVPGNFDDAKLVEQMMIGFHVINFAKIKVSVVTK